MIIYIPNKFIPERKYIIDIIFGEFLQIDYKIVVSEKFQDYEILLSGGKKLIIKDQFFKQFDDGLNYLTNKNIPVKAQFVKNQFLTEEYVPIIFGDDELVVVRDKIVCGIDILASIFFMLTRWEEYTNKIRDKHNRFPAQESLAYKNGFLGRPIVNEYIEMLWSMFLKLGIQEKRKERKFEMFLTHDVDDIQKYKNTLSGYKEICGDFIKRLNPSLGFKNIKAKFLIRAGLKKDPYDTFDYLMDVSEKAGLKSNFLLMGKGASKYDNSYNLGENFLKRIVFNIKERGHSIGLHATYNAYNDKEQFMKEKSDVENLCDMEIKTGRQHYLRFEAPVTWQVWEDNGMEWDSTLSYADKEGFRCGTCYEYSVFNFLTREKLNLKEKPLIVMDGSFISYQPEITPEEMVSKIQMLVDKCRKYNGTFVFLWHNSSFNTDQWRPFGKVYEDIVTRNMKR